MARLSLRRLRFRESRLVSIVLITPGSRSVGASYREYGGGESNNGDSWCPPVIPKLQLLKKQGSAGCGNRLGTTRSTRKITHDVTPSVVALRLLHLQRGNSLTLPIEGAPTTQEVETTNGFGHEGHLQA